jgi:hypothetical protein
MAAGCTYTHYTVQYHTVMHCTRLMFNYIPIKNFIIFSYTITHSQHTHCTSLRKPYTHTHSLSHTSLLTPPPQHTYTHTQNSSSPSQRLSLLFNMPPNADKRYGTVRDGTVGYSAVWVRWGIVRCGDSIV